MVLSEDCKEEGRGAGGEVVKGVEGEGAEEEGEEEGWDDRCQGVG